MSEEQTVSLVDVLEEDEELEEEASAVLAGSDSDHCSYPQVSACLLLLLLLLIIIIMNCRLNIRHCMHACVYL